ncbi:RAMP superfamily CRISPR-associated protein [Candidatus Caldatribacterium sp.]|uniref:RAMP superfamily CRISPR-associated protein n=1 Tax=Candidatus Caldatribacterium sp. TaxID=2282143 RepID=UPI0038441C60|nr:RAMP superfamily CRISPR-associated protein [Candidatus Caldatribacterium sp.]
MTRNNNKQKPFFWIPLPKEVPREEPVWHDRFIKERCTGKAILVVTVSSEYLFVGSGAYEHDNKNFWMSFFQANGKICIPGTSLKGAIRSIAEAISSSCVLQRRWDKEQRRRGEEVSEDQKACRNINNGLCPACRIFGAIGFRGRVSFSDALSQDEVKKRKVTEIVKIGSLFGPRKYQSSRKFYQVGSASFSTDLEPEENYQCLEVVPKETKFRTTLYFENMAEDELGLVFAALGWDSENGQVKPVFTPKIGGAKPRCFGAVRFGLGRISFLHLPSWNLQPLEKNETLRFVACCIEKAKKSGLIQIDAWEKLKEGFKAKNNFSCPRDVY